MTDIFQTLLGFVTPPGRPSEGESCQGPIAHPRRDWLYSGAAFLLVLAALLTFDAVIYFSPAGASAVSTASITAAPEMPDFDSLIRSHKAAASEHAALLSGTPAVSDPSK